MGHVGKRKEGTEKGERKETRMGDPSTVFPACSCSEYMYCKHGLLSHFSGRSLHRAIIQVAAKATENHYSPSLSIPKPLSGNVKHWKITKGFFFATKRERKRGRFPRALMGVHSITIRSIQRKKERVSSRRVCE